MNIDFLAISELKWMGMGEFNSDDHYIYYCGQESLRKNGVAIIVNKRVQNAVLRCSLKNDRLICLFPRQTTHYHSNPNLCPNCDAREAEVDCFYDDLQHLLELIPKKMSFSSQRMECKSRKSRHNWINRQVWPWSTK